MARPGRHWREAGARAMPRSTFGGFAARAFSDTRLATRSAVPHALHTALAPSTHTLRFSRPSTVPSARRTFELFAEPALAYKYEGQWRGPAPDHGASRIHIGINWRCSRRPPHWFYCLSIGYSQLAKSSPPERRHDRFRVHVARCLITHVIRHYVITCNDSKCKQSGCLCKWMCQWMTFYFLVKYVIYSDSLRKNSAW